MVVFQHVLEHDRARDATLLFSLDRILASAGIEPISEEKIEEYKEKEIRRHPPTLIWKITQKVGGQSAMEMLLLTFLALSFIALIGSLCLLSSFPDAGAMTAIFETAIVVSGGALVSLFILTSAKRTFAGPAHWEDTNFTYYQIPVFAKEMVGRIWAVSQKIRFSTDELKQDEISLDPILYAHFKGEKKAICVWDAHGTQIHL